MKIHQLTVQNFSCNKIKIMLLKSVLFSGFSSDAIHVEMQHDQLLGIRRHRVEQTSCKLTQG